MIFWASILVGILISSVAIKMGFFESFAGFFNLLIAIYLGLFLTPIVLEIAPQAGDIPLGVTITGIALTIGIFVLLYAICFFCITGQFKVKFPQVFDTIFAGSLGFLGGILMASFIAIMFSGAALPVIETVTETNRIDSNTRYVCWWCDHLHRWVGTKDRDLPSPTKAAIVDIWDLIEERKSQTPTDPNTGMDPTASPSDIVPLGRD